MYEDIIKRHRPRGWRVRASKTKTLYAEKSRKHYERTAKFSQHQNDLAYASPVKREIVGPSITDPFTLHIVLHEFAHVALKHWGAGESALHREEFEADRWAMEIMRLEGIAVPLSVKRAARGYVTSCIKKDEQNGEAIHDHVARWALRG